MGALIEVKDLTKRFEAENGRLWKREFITAVDHVSFDIQSGETVGLLGESGCGKSTIARMLAGLIPPTEGEIYYHGEDVTGRIDQLRRDIQMVFQNPFASLDPRMKIQKALLEPLNLWKIGTDQKERMDIIRSMCDECGLEQDTLNKYPSEFSGGQLQRISIARALLTEPQFLIADEIVSALDVSVQAQILALLNRMKERHGLTVLFITHDLSVVRKMCDKVMAMYAGKIVDRGSCGEVMDHPENTYMRSLKRAAFPLYGKRVHETKAELE